MNRKAITLLEVVIVASLATTVLLVIMNVISSSQKNYSVGTEMMDTQLMMEQILLNLNNDFKKLIRLTKVNPEESIEMLVRDLDQEVKVLYRFEKGPSGGKLIRKATYFDGKIIEKDFQSTDMISEIKFLQADKTTSDGFEWPEHLTIALRVMPKSEKSKVSLAIVTQFYSNSMIKSQLDRRK